MLKDMRAMINLRFEMKSNDDARNESLSNNRISHRRAREWAEKWIFCALSSHHAGEIYLSAFIIHTRYARREKDGIKHTCEKKWKISFRGGVSGDDKASKTAREKLSLLTHAHIHVHVISVPKIIIDTWWRISLKKCEMTSFIIIISSFILFF